MFRLTIRELSEATPRQKKDGAMIRRSRLCKGQIAAIMMIIMPAC